ncbi:MAG: hypothetical protein ABJH57_19470 [Cyclobacteriaceae bacterium]
MNKQKFVEFIRKPANLTSKDIEDLESVVENFPYFQNARIILAKGGKIKDLPDSKRKIATAAIYATNRALLKKYIQDELIFLRPLEVHESVLTDKRPAEATPKAKPSPKPVVQEKPESASQTDTPSPAPIKEKPASPQANETVSEPEPLDAPISAEVEDHNDLDDLISDLWHDIEELRKSKAKFLAIEKRLEEDEAVEKAVEKATKKSKATKPTAKKPTTAQKSTSTKKSTTKTASSSSKKSAAKKTGSTTKKPAAKKSASSAKKTTTPKSKSESPKKEDKTDPKSLQDSIIDQFINSEPAMPPARKSDGTGSSEDLSKDSAELNPEVASEYLAEIYLEQGNKPRALQIYEKLIVMFPEKSVYFADIIKKLNKEK